MFQTSTIVMRTLSVIIFQDPSLAPVMMAILEMVLHVQVSITKLWNLFLNVYRINVFSVVIHHYIYFIDYKFHFDGYLVDF